VRRGLLPLALLAVLPIAALAQGDAWINPPDEPDVDCVELVYQDVAQLVLQRNPTDPFNLDPSGDGVACSSLPTLASVGIELVISWPGAEEPAPPMAPSPTAAARPPATRTPRVRTPEPEPTPEPTRERQLGRNGGRNAQTGPAEGGDNCHPAYRECLPIVDDLDCPEIDNREIRLLDPADDPYGLDVARGVGNGIACDGIG